jgi:hypothetical protein
MVSTSGVPSPTVAISVDTGDMATWFTRDARCHAEVVEDPSKPDEEEAWAAATLKHGEAKLLAKESGGKTKAPLGSRHRSRVIAWTSQASPPASIFSSHQSPILLSFAMIVRVRHPVGNPKRKIWWAQQQVFPQYETKVYRTSRRKNQLPKVDARWLGDSSRQFIYGALSGA